MYDEFIAMLKKCRDRHELIPETFDDSDIQREQERFGQLPNTYCEFLKQVPTGVFFNEAFILYEGPLSFEDLSLQVRTDAEDGLLAFGDDLAGTILCFDTTSPGPDGEWPIVEYVYPDYRVQVASNFYEWIMGMIGVLA
jgi:hypothetical protein